MVQIYKKNRNGTVEKGNTLTICVKFIPSLFKSLLCDICALLVNATSVNAGIINYCNDIKNAKIHFVIEKSN